MTNMKNFQVILAICIFGIISVILVYNFQNNFEAVKLEQSSNLNDSYDVELKNLPIKDPHVKKILSQCGIEVHCTVDGLLELAKLENKKTVLSAVNDILSIYEEIGYYCHQNGHHLGMFVYGFSGNLSEAISSVERRCGGSIYHGIIENYFASAVMLKNQNVDELEIANICDELSDSKLTIMECLHGVGHGLMKAYNYDFSSALTRCDEFELAQECYNGASMANGNFYLETNKESLNGNDIIQFCTVLEKKYQPYCYLYQANNLLISKNLSTKDSFTMCDTIENNDETRYCYSGIGAQLVGRFLHNLEGVVFECQKGDPNYQTACILGSEGILLDQLGNDKGFEFCKIIPEKFKSDCYAKISFWLKNTLSSKEEIKNSCSAAENQKYYETCVSGKPDRINCSAILIEKGTNGTNTTKDITDLVKCGF